MFTKETSSIVEAAFQETYASASRVNETIQSRLTAILDDYSLADEVINEFDDIEWVS